MIKQTFKFALRSFRKSTLVHFLNVTGLTLGLAVYFLVTLYLYQENSYERGFSKQDRIYQLSYTMIGHRMAKGAPNLWHVLHEVPEIETYTSFKVGPTTSVKINDVSRVAKVYTVDSAFLKVFDYELVSGSGEAALARPNHAVLSESYAKEIFGSTDVLNEVFYLTRNKGLDSSYQVPIVVNGVALASSFKTQLDFDILVSEERLPESDLILNNWQSSSVFNYAVVSPGTTSARLDERLFDLSYKYIMPKTYGGKLASKEEWIEAPLYCGFYSESLSGLRVGSDTTGNLMPSLDEAQFKTMGIVALAALIISILNFISLSTSRASVRMKEVGVKRILGASNKQLILQFMMESFLAILLSSVLALGVVELMVKLKSRLIGIQVDYSVLQTKEWITGLIVFVVGLTLVSGIYPALYLSSANLSSVLKNGKTKESFSILNAAVLRKGAAILQFTFSAGLIIAVLTMYNQVQHLQSRDMGYEPESVLVLNTYHLKESKNTFRDQLAKYPSISSAAHTNRLPFTETFERPRSIKVSDSTEFDFTMFTVDDTFFETVSMNFVSGVGFKEHEGNTLVKTEGSTDSETGKVYPMVVNEMAAKIIGYDVDPSKGLLDDRFQIIGVVNDFVFSDLRQQVEPVILNRKTYSGVASYHYPLLVRVNDLNQARADVQELWSEFSNIELDIQLMESSFKNLLKIEEDGLQAVLVFSIVSVIVSCLGLFGLAVFTLDQRIHEFGVRKVLGASVADIMKLFGSGFMKLIAIAFVLAIPASIYLLNEWLSTYADRVSLNFDVFLVAAMLVVLIVGVTLLAQSLKAGRLNPVETLRNE
ncbi:FtsX-like permease family protein [Roseivirga pacifica]|uniref:ABC transporter permease n=1 Tax=Roseivirga pacifica TaxID=1267423 RepID=UPI003BB0FB07